MTSLMQNEDKWSQDWYYHPHRIAVPVKESDELFYCLNNNPNAVILNDDDSALLLSFLIFDIVAFDIYFLLIKIILHIGKFQKCHNKKWSYSKI